jgi:hypothetical protein
MRFEPGLASPYITSDGKDWQQSYDAMRGLLQGERPDGVFCYNDPIALAAIEVVLDEGLRIPEDIAFVGCDNLHFDSTLKAPLSSIDHHSDQVGVVEPAQEQDTSFTTARCAETLARGAAIFATQWARSGASLSTPPC